MTRRSDPNPGAVSDTDTRGPQNLSTTFLRPAARTTPRAFHRDVGSARKTTPLSDAWRGVTEVL
jgi:hypothetical protein